MLRSRLTEAAVVGCLAAAASFCALCARAAETYSIVAQSTAASAATGRRPIGERIAAANVPLITRSAEADAGVVADAAAPGSSRWDAPAVPAAPYPDENLAVAAVSADRLRADEPQPPKPESPSQPPPTAPIRWPFSPKWPTFVPWHTTAKERPTGTNRADDAGRGTTTPSRHSQPSAAVTTAPPRTAAVTTSTGRTSGRQTTARSSGNGLSSSSPSSVTR